MSKVAWHLLEGRQARARLVVGAIVQANGPAGLNDSTAAQAVLKRLLSKQMPVGDYAATVVREVGWPEVYLAFDDEADAPADAIGSHPGWASQRAFELDSAKLRELEAPPDGSPFGRRLRRGPWTPIKRYNEE